MTTEILHPREEEDEKLLTKELVIWWTILLLGVLGIGLTMALWRHP